MKCMMLDHPNLISVLSLDQIIMMLLYPKILKKLNKNRTKAMRDSEVRVAGLVPKGRGLVSMHLFKVFKVNFAVDLLYVPTLLLEAKTSQSIQ